MLVDDRGLTGRVGAIAIAVLAVAIGFVVFVYPRIEWHTRVRVHVYLRDVGGLRPGVGFVVAGRSVGRVESIVPVTRREHGSLDGAPGLVVTVAIDADAARRIQVPAEVFVGSRGVVAERYLELASSSPTGRPLRDGDHLLGASPATLDSVLQHSLVTMIAMRRFADDMQPELAALMAQLDEVRDHVEAVELARLAARISGARVEATHTSDRLGGRAGIGNARTLVGDARETLVLARTLLADLTQRAELVKARTGVGAELVREAAPRLDGLIVDLRRVGARTELLLAAVAVIEERVDGGEGSLMKLLVDPEFPDDMKDLGKVLKRQPWKLMTTPGD